MRSTTRRRANFVAENSTHLHQGLCFSTTPHCLARSATLNRLNTSLLHYGRWHPLVTICMQTDKHATPRQAQDTTQTGCSLHWNRTQTKRSRGKPRTQCCSDTMFGMWVHDTASAHCTGILHKPKRSVQLQIRDLMFE